MNFKNRNVQLDAIWNGCAFGLTIIVVDIIANGPPADDLLLRAFFGFALAVLSKPAVDGAMIDLASDNPPRFARYYFGWAMGAMWGGAMIIAFWPLMPVQVVIWIIGGAFFGTVMAAIHKPEPVAAERLALYDLSKNIYAGWHPAWRIVPNIFLAVCVGGILILAAQDDDISPYLGLGMIAALMNSTAPYVYKHRGLKALHLIIAPLAIIAGYLVTF